MVFPPLFRQGAEARDASLFLSSLQPPAPSWHFLDEASESQVQGPPEPPAPSPAHTWASPRRGREHSGQGGCRVQVLSPHILAE